MADCRRSQIGGTARKSNLSQALSRLQLAPAAASRRPTGSQPAYKASSRGRGQEILAANGAPPPISDLASTQVFRSVPETKSEIERVAGHLPRGVRRPERKGWEDNAPKLRIALPHSRILPRCKSGSPG